MAVFTLMVVLVLPIVAAPPDPGDPGCTVTNPNGGTMGFQSTSCSDILLDLSCSLVPGATETVDRGRYTGKTFNYDAQCYDVFGGLQVYHYKTTEAVYKDGVDGYAGTHDTFIRPDAPDSVMPSNFAMEIVSRIGGIPWLRGVVRFSGQQALPLQAQVLDAKLTLVCQEAVPSGGVPGHLAGGGMSVGAYGLLQGFNQDEATWNVYATGQNWGVPGAEGPTDRMTTADEIEFIGTKCNGDATLPAGDPVVPTPYEWNVLSSYLAQSDLGSQEYGWVLFTNDADEDSVRFFTHEMSQTNSPELRLKYVK